MDLTDLKKSITEMSNDEILEAIRLLRHSRTTDDVIHVIKAKKVKNKEDDLAAKLLKLAGSPENLALLLAKLK
jgi:hypothetical protein